MTKPTSHPHWKSFKKDMMEHWKGLTDEDIEKTQGNKESLLGLLERKLGLELNQVSGKMDEMTSHYHLYDEPVDQNPVRPSRAY